jgi:hypothetical protein
LLQRIFYRLFDPKGEENLHTKDDIECQNIDANQGQDRVMFGLRKTLPKLLMPFW